VTKYVRRDPEVVDAIKYVGGDKERNAMIYLINRGPDSAYRDEMSYLGETIRVVGDWGAASIHVGDWVLFHEDQTLSFLEDDEFHKLYRKAPIPKRRLIWKDIPGHRGYQISDGGTVRDIRWRATYKKRTKAGDFILWDRGHAIRWSEKEIGDEEAIRAFFSS
jgi:hydrogenase maturation factor